MYHQKRSERSGMPYRHLLQAIGHLPKEAIQTNENVVVQGAGAVGLAAIMMAKLAGANKMVVLGSKQVEDEESEGIWRRRLRRHHDHHSRRRTGADQHDHGTEALASLSNAQVCWVRYRKVLGCSPAMGSTSLLEPGQERARPHLIRLWWSTRPSRAKRARIGV